MAGELGGAAGVGQEAEVTDAAEAVGQDMQQEAADELAGVERHHLGLVVLRDNPSSGSGRCPSSQPISRLLAMATRWV